MTGVGVSIKQAAQQGAVWVYGSGSMAVRVAHALETALEVVAHHLEFSDESASSTTSYSLVQDVNLSGAVVVIGVHNEFGDTHSLTARLRSVGSAVVPFPSLVRELEEFGFEFSNYMLSSNSAIRAEFAKRTAPLRSSFSDARSLEVFDGFVAYVGSCEERDIGTDEIPPNPFGVHPRNRPVGTFVEAGAFEGGHLDALNPLPNRYIGFEPLPSAFRKLGQKIATVGIDGLALPLALGNVSGPQRLVSDGTGSVLGAVQGDVSVFASRLDDIVGATAVDVLRMDIEGAEIEALEGARRTLELHRPALQVAVYHRPFDLADLVEKISGFGYRDFYLRTHRHNFFDTFLYC